MRQIIKFGNCWSIINRWREKEKDREKEREKEQSVSVERLN